jgi:hypothetical protein
MIYLGIDTGLGGAIAYYDAAAGDLLGIDDMPVDRVAVGKVERGRISATRLLAMLKPLAGAKAFVERPEARPLRGVNKKDGTTLLRRPGSAGMLAFGESYGVVYCALIACGIAVVEVRPGKWKRGAGVPAGKDEARRIASQRFPRWSGNFMRKKDNGRAEAALLGAWGSKQ